MVFSSAAAVVRRCTLRSGKAGIIRSLCYHSLARTPLTSKLTSTKESATAPALAPWLKIYESLNYIDGSSFKFYSLTDEKMHSFFPRIDEMERPRGEMVGSTQGWVVLYHTENHGVTLIDPITDQFLTLPNIGGVLHRLIVVDKKRLAVAAAGSFGRLALCRPQQSSEWTPFPSERTCDSLVYSSRHRRLFCITRDGNNGSDLEIWNLQGEAPKLEWKMDLDAKSKPPHPPYLKKLKYVACAEHSGEVYVVERHFKIRHGLNGRFVDDIIGSEYRGDFNYYPYHTTNFKVYKVDREGKRLIRMKGSLDGVAIFIGLNEPMAIPAAEVAGVKPDSIYFTYDRRIRYKYNEYIKYRDEEVGRLDYSTGKFKPAFISYIDSELRYELMWFAPPNIYI